MVCTARLTVRQSWRSENQSLIGRYLLAESRIEIDLTPGGAVIITEIPSS